MTKSFTHPSSRYLLERVSDVFKSKKIVQRKDRHILFLCGGSVAPRSRYMRKRFINYSEDSLPEFRMFLAEAATRDLTQHGSSDFVNIADFEELVSEISDCIVLFPESPGSIAEVGFFANSNNAIKKLLVINDVAKQGESFINIGIFDKINKESNFRPVLVMDYKHPNFGMIKERLSRLPLKTTKSFEIKKFSSLKDYEKLYVIFQIVFIFKALTFEDIMYCLRQIIGSNRNDSDKVKHLLSILIATKYIERRGDAQDYFVPTSTTKPFLEFRNYDIQDLQAIITSFFKQHKVEAYDFIEG